MHSAYRLHLHVRILSLAHVSELAAIGFNILIYLHLINSPQEPLGATLQQVGASDETHHGGESQQQVSTSRSMDWQLHEADIGAHPALEALRNSHGIQLGLRHRFHCIYIRNKHTQLPEVNPVKFHL